MASTSMSAAVLQCRPNSFRTCVSLTRVAGRRRGGLQRFRLFLRNSANDTIFLGIGETLPGFEMASRTVVVWLTTKPYAVA